MTRKIAAAVLIIAIFTSMFGCSSSKTETEQVSDKSTISVNIGQYSSKEESSSASSSSASEKSEAESSGKTASSFWDSASKKIGSDDLYIFQAYSFSENAAWVTIAQDKNSGILKNAMLCLIDTEGKMLYSFPVQDTEYKDYYTTNFSNGVSLVSDEDNQYIISNKGKVVWSVLDNGVSEGERLFGKDSVESIVLDNCNKNGAYSYSDNMIFGVNVFNGWTLVDMHVNNYDGTGNYYGILNPDGSWLLEPQKKEIYMDPYTHYAYWQNDDTTLHGDTYVGINLETKETVDCGYKEGSVLATSPDNCETIIGWESTRHLKEQNGLIFDKDKNAFVDSSGASVIDCSKYTFMNNFVPKFHNGYSVLAIENPDGSPYITVIDTTGNQLFEPIKNDIKGNPDNDKYGYVENDRFVMTAAYEPDFYEMERSADGDKGGEYYDLTGKKMTDIYSGYQYIYPYSCGFALVKDNYGNYKYLDTSGKEVFKVE
jgi:hypothetical protein